MKDIKGITIEIGGDTTELGKALSNSQKNLAAVDKELREVNKLLKLDPGNTVLLAQKQELLAKKAKESAGKLDVLREVAEQVDRQLDEGGIDKDKYRAFRREVEAAGMSAKAAAKDVDNFGNEAAETGNEVESATGKFDAAKDKLKKIGSAIKEAFSLGAVAAGVKKLSSAVTSLAADSAAYADNIRTLSINTGIAADKLQTYSYAAELVDVSVDTIAKSMAKNTKSMSSAANGSKAYEQAYKSLGVSVKDANGHLRDSEDVFWDTIDALGKIENETERDALSMQIFGKSAQELNSLIAVGSDGMKGYAAEAKSMGAVLSSSAINSLGELDNELQRNKQAFAALKNQIGAQIAPTITSFIKNMTSGVKGSMPTIKVMVSDVVKGASDFLRKLKPVADAGKRIINALRKELKPIITEIKPLISSIFDLVGKVGNGVVVPLLSKVFKLISPIVEALAKISTWATNALSSVVGYLSGVDDKTRQLQDAAKDAAQAWDDLKSSVADAFEDTKEVKKIDKLKNKLEQLTDSNGNLKGDEKELKSVIKQLCDEGFEVEYDAINKQITKRDELVKKIDEVIAKKRYENKISAMEELANGAEEKKSEAVQRRGEAKSNYYQKSRDAIAELKKQGVEGITQADIDKIFKAKDLDKAYLDFIDANGLQDLRITADELFGSIKQAADVVNSCDDEIGTYQRTIQEFDDALALGTEGKFEEASQKIDAFATRNQIIAESGKTLAESTVQEMTTMLEGYTGSMEDAINSGDLDLAKTYADKIATTVELVSEKGGTINTALAESIISDMGRFEELGGNLPALFCQGVEDKLPYVKKVSAMVPLNARAGMTSDAGTEEGKKAGASYATNISASYLKAKEAGERVSEGAASGMAKGKSQAEALGQSFGSGWITGLNSMRSKISQAASNIARTAEKAVKAAQKTNSPSKVAMALGSSFGEGYAGGIVQRINDVKNASGRLAVAAAAPIATTSSMTITNNNTFNGASARDGAALIRQVDRQLGEIYRRRT